MKLMVGHVCPKCRVHYPFWTDSSDNQSKIALHQPWPAISPKPDILLNVCKDCKADMVGEIIFYKGPDGETIYFGGVKEKK